MRIIVGVSGASGVVIGYRLVEVLHGIEGVETHLVVTEAAKRTLELEAACTYEQLCALADVVHDDANMGAAISSGSFATSGMVVAPCSMKTLSGIVHAYDANLFVRSADVCLKEGRKVVLVPREMPLNQAHLRNMLQAAQDGCSVVPPMLTFYNGPQTLQDQVDHVVGKVLMQFGIEHGAFKPWAGA